MSSHGRKSVCAAVAAVAAAVRLVWFVCNVFLQGKVNVHTVYKQIYIKKTFLQGS